MTSRVGGAAAALARIVMWFASANRPLKEKVNVMKLLKTRGKITLAGVMGLGALVILCSVLTSGDYAVAITVAQDSSIPHITITGVTFHAAW